MNILFCNYEYPPLGGGGGVVMAALARALTRRHSVTVLTSRALGLPAESRDGDVRVLRAPVLFRRDLATANFASMFAYLPAAFVRGLALRKHEFDVVNTHFVVPTGPVGQALASVFGVPNVLSVHGGDLFDPSKRSSPHRLPLLHAPIRYLLRRADAVVAQSQDTRRHVQEIYGVTRSIDLVPLGIERPASVSDANREYFVLPRDELVLVTVGRLVARKNTVQLVRALADPRLARAHLLVVGDGPDAPNVRQAAAEAGVAHRVHMLGFLGEADKNRALAVADVFVSTSQHEGFGLVFLEAMAFGLPVVCYDHGGQTDFLATGETGSVVKLDDVGAFVHAIALLGDSGERRRIGANNLQKVEHYFIDRCAERYEAIFQAAIARSRAAHPGRTRVSGAR
jgi:glycosyltransferase involved in cell wall biosynthesis